MVEKKLRSTRLVSLAILLLVPVLTCHGQGQDQTKLCFDQAGPQVELNACASADAKRADTELNVVYKQLLAKNATDPIALAKVKTFERAWIAYRDAYLAATYPAEDKRANYGSMFAMEWGMLYADITRSHIKTLHELMNGDHIN